MKKIVHENYEELIPEDNYIADIEESFVCEGLCAKHIDESQYKDVTDDEAIEIMKKIQEDEEEPINEIGDDD